MSQLLPDKFVPVRQTLIGQGSEILSLTSERAWSVAELFIAARERLPRITYDQFVLTLDLLFATDLVALVDDEILEESP